MQRMASRTRVKSRASGQPWRWTLMVTLVPGSPRSFLTASMRVMDLVISPSMRRIWSPERMPWRSAGVSSMGETTFTKPSSVPTSMPSPPNSPWVPTCSSR